MSDPTGNKMSSDPTQHIADIGAAVSTASVAAYTFTDYLHDAALGVAILSGSLAAAWHIYRFYQEFKSRKGANDGTNGTKDKKPGTSNGSTK